MRNLKNFKSQNNTTISNQEEPSSHKNSISPHSSLGRMKDAYRTNLVPSEWSKKIKESGAFGVTSDFQ